MSRVRAVSFELGMALLALATVLCLVAAILATNDLRGVGLVCLIVGLGVATYAFLHMDPS